MKIIRHKINHKVLCAGFIEAERPEFDPSIFEEIELDILPEGFELYKEMPIANGKDLIKFINEASTTLTDEQITEILTKLSGFYLQMEQKRYNPMTLGQFENLKTNLNNLFTDTAKIIIIQLLDEWAKNVHFKTG
jgi:hypothetical protein